MSEEEAPLSTWLSVPEAARLLNVSERSLRRILKAPEHWQATQAGTRRERRQTNTGARDATVLAPSFVEALRARLAGQGGPQDAGANGGAEHRQDDGATTAQTQVGTAATVASDGAPVFSGEVGAMLTAASEMRLAVVYERLIEAKDAEIVRMVARVEALEGALQREQENTARAQALQAMQPQVLAATSAAQDVPPQGAEGQVERVDGSTRGGQQKAPREPRSPLRRFLLRWLRG